MKTFETQLNESFQENELFEKFEQSLEEGMLAHTLALITTVIPSGMIWVSSFLSYSLANVSAYTTMGAGAAKGMAVAATASWSGFGATATIAGITVPFAAGTVLLGLGALMISGILAKDIVMKIVKKMKDRRYEQFLNKLLANKGFVADVSKHEINGHKPGPKDKKAMEKLTKKYFEIETGTAPAV